MTKRSVEFSISKKWREFRIKLWNEFYDPLRSKDELIKNVPNGLSMEQWALFVDYCLKPSTMNLCKRNQEIRKKQTIPHTGGAMPLSRRREYMRIETGKHIDHGEMWKVTHKRKNGNYVNDEAMEIGEKIDEYLSQNSENGSVISPDDAIGVIFEKEHVGRVRGLGTGVCRTTAFKHTSTRIKGVSLGSYGASTSDMEKWKKRLHIWKMKWKK